MFFIEKQQSEFFAIFFTHFFMVYFMRFSHSLKIGIVYFI